MMAAAMPIASTSGSWSFPCDASTAAVMMLLSPGTMAPAVSPATSVKSSAYATAAGSVSRPGITPGGYTGCRFAKPSGTVSAAASRVLSRYRGRGARPYDAGPRAGPGARPPLGGRVRRAQPADLRERGGVPDADRGGRARLPVPRGARPAGRDEPLDQAHGARRRRAAGAVARRGRRLQRDAD